MAIALKQHADEAVKVTKAVQAPKGKIASGVLRMHKSAARLSRFSATGVLGLAGAGNRTPSQLDWVAAIRKGLPAKAIDFIMESVDTSQTELAVNLKIPERTLIRRKQEGTLSPDESAKLVRVARTMERAQEVFGGIDAAKSWLKASNTALDGASPISLLDTDVGAESVLDTLGRIQHGVFG